MSAELITLIAALIVAWLVFTWLLKVVKASVTTALTIAIVVLILQFVFGIQIEEIAKQIFQLPEIIFNWFK
jgi:ABC-type multidrug transport system permease subunit